MDLGAPLTGRVFEASVSAAGSKCRPDSRIPTNETDESSSSLEKNELVLSLSEWVISSGGKFSTTEDDPDGSGSINCSSCNCESILKCRLQREEEQRSTGQRHAAFPVHLSTRQINEEVVTFTDRRIKCFAHLKTFWPPKTAVSGLCQQKLCH